MFRATVTELTNSSKTREFDIVVSTTKMYELLGRYTFKYGPPELDDDTDGIFSYEFLSIGDDGTRYRVGVSCCRIAKDEPMFVTNKQSTSVVSNNGHRTYDPPPPKKQYAPLETRLQKFKDEGIGY